MGVLQCQPDQLLLAGCEPGAARWCYALPRLVMLPACLHTLIPSA